jgi:hypothetical protein
MGLFYRKPADQTEIEALIMAHDLNAAHKYLRRFVDGGTIEQDYILRALALVSVSEYRG